jgi:hypothetical protein
VVLESPRFAFGRINPDTSTATGFFLDATSRPTVDGVNSGLEALELLLNIPVNGEAFGQHGGRALWYLENGNYLKTMDEAALAAGAGGSAVLGMTAIMPSARGAARAAPVARQISPYAGKTAAEINKIIGPQQRQLLRDFFGTGLKGARQRAGNFNVPQGLNRQTLEAYEELARRAINSGADKAGVQAARLELLERAYGAIP